MRLKRVINNKNNKRYRINIDLYSSLDNGEFLVGDKVFNKKYNLKGRVQKIESDVLLVKYSDGTIERINKDNAINVLSYVDDIQTAIDPMSPQISKNNVEKIINNLAEAQELFKEENINENKYNMRINKEYEKLKVNKEKNIKEDKINKLINLGVSKGLIDKDEVELEKTKLSMMAEEDFKEYEDNIISYNSKSIVTSKINQEINPNLTEAERALLEIKNGNNVVANIDYSKIPNSSKSRNLSDLTMSNNKLNHKSNVMLNNMIDNNQYSYNNNSWMDELDWTITSRN